VGQPDLDEFAGPRVDGRPCLDPQDGVALPAVPLAYRVAGIAVGDAALALDGVQEVDPLGRRGPDGSRGFDQLFLLAGEGHTLALLGQNWLHPTICYDYSVGRLR